VPTPRRAETTERREQVRGDVVLALQELLQEGVPYSDIGIERLAQRTGISRTAFYFYFRDKREVLERLTSSVATELFVAAETWLGASTGRDGLRAALCGLTDVFAKHAAILRAVVEVTGYEREVARYWYGVIQRFIDATAAQIAAEQTAGRAPGYDPAATAFALVWGVERTLFQQVARDTAFEHDDVVEALTGIWLRAIYGGAEPVAR